MSRTRQTDYADDWNAFVRTFKVWVDKVDLVAESLKGDHKTHALSVQTRKQQRAADHAFTLLKIAWHDLTKSITS